ncbi:hypothetical protein Syun_002489 [Stephania yunnanensis]|uniref:Retroviral polymerase SH3-like domain-containing protein n=1 Tax=Stephania yunnanensis TaxID=152371 RepID=A0AAP0Q8U6_9MAGN
MQLILGQQPNISHLRIFGCVVYVPIPPPNRTKMGPQRKLGIYVGFNPSSIIRYLEPLTGDLFTARFADCHFDEAIFPPLGGDKKPIQKEWREIAWNASTLSHYDPRTNQCELEVQKIIHLQQIANQLPDAFNDAKQVTKSHIPAVNAPARIDVSVQQNAQEPTKRLKRGRPVGSKDTIPRKRKTGVKINTNQNTPEKAQESFDKGLSEQVDSDEEQLPLEKEEKDENNEISINYLNSGKIWDRNEIVHDDIFAFNVSFEICENDDDPEPRSVDECRKRPDWQK